MLLVRNTLIINIKLHLPVVSTFQKRCLRGLGISVRIRVRVGVGHGHGVRVRVRICPMVMASLCPPYNPTTDPNWQWVFRGYNCLALVLALKPHSPVAL